MLKLRKFRLAPAVLILLLLSILTINLNFMPCHALSSIDYYSQLSHSIEINNYGQLYINDTFTLENNGTSQVLIPEIAMTYPGQYYNRMSVDSVSDPNFQVSFSNVSNLTIIRLAPTKDMTINPSVEYNLSVTFSAHDLISSESAKLFYAYLTLYPGVNLGGLKIVSKMYLPPGAAFTNLTGYQNTTNLADQMVYSRNYNNTVAGTYNYQNLTLGVDPTSNVLLIDVPQAERTLQVNDDGSILVSDTIQLKNLSQKNVTSLNLALLNPDLLSVSVVEPIGPDKSSNLGPNQQFLLDKELMFNETYTFTITYPAPEGMIRFVNGKYVGNITTFPPLDAIINEYTIKADFSDGIAPKQPSMKTFLNADRYTGGSLIIEYEPQLFWSTTTIVPIGLIVLIIILGAFSLFQREEGKEKEYSSEFFDTVQDKLQLVSSTLELYEERRTGQTIKQRFNVLKQEYLSRASQMNNSLLRITEDLEKENPERKQLERVIRLNRDLDQALKVVVSDYDGLQSGKIGKDEFNKRRSESIKKLDSIRKEIEEEISTI